MKKHLTLILIFFCLITSFKVFSQAYVDLAQRHTGPVPAAMMTQKINQLRVGATLPIVRKKTAAFLFSIPSGKKDGCKKMMPVEM